MAVRGILIRIGDWTVKCLQFRTHAFVRVVQVENPRMVVWSGIEVTENKLNTAQTLLFQQFKVIPVVATCSTHHCSDSNLLYAKARSINVQRL